MAMKGEKFFKGKPLTVKELKAMECKNGSFTCGMIQRLTKKGLLKKPPICDLCKREDLVKAEAWKEYKKKHPVKSDYAKDGFDAGWDAGKKRNYNFTLAEVSKGINLRVLEHERKIECERNKLSVQKLKKGVSKACFKTDHLRGIPDLICADCVQLHYLIDSVFGVGK